MKKMAKVAALVAALVLTTSAFAADFPEYLKMDGTKVTGYSGKLPADLVIPEGVTEIAGGAFKGCLDIESVTIPGSVTEIRGVLRDRRGYSYKCGAFEECTYLERVTIGEGVQEIGEHAFKGCTSLESVSIPGSVTTIDENAFEGCASLASVTIADGVQTIGSSAFFGCPFESVIIPKSVTSIGGQCVQRLRVACERYDRRRLGDNWL